jgi:hypothetical protein
MCLHRLQIGLGANPACFLLMYYDDFGMEYIVDAVWVNTDSSESAKEWQKQITDAQINYQKLKLGEEVKSHPRLPRMRRQSIIPSSSPLRDDQETEELGSRPTHEVTSICRNMSTTSSPSRLTGVEYRAKKVSLASSLRSSRPVSEISTGSRVSVSSDTWSRFDSSSDEELPGNGKALPFRKEFLGSNSHTHPLAVNSNGVFMDRLQRRSGSGGFISPRKSISNENSSNDSGSGETYITNQSMHTLSPLTGNSLTKERSRSCFELDVSSECV